MRMKSLCASMFFVLSCASLAEASVLCQKNFARATSRYAVNLAGTLIVVEGSVCPAGYSLVTDTSVFQGPKGDKGDTGLQGPPGAGPRTYRFAGISAQTFSTAAKWLELTRACYAEYQDGKIATTAEFRNTINPPLIAAAAWISPTAPITGFDNPGTSAPADGFIDGAGVVYGISSPPETPGTILDTDGLIYFTGGGTRPVACSVPE